MTKQLLMGVDIGTSSSKGVLVEVSSGQVVARKVIEHAVRMPKPGWFEQDAEETWWGEFVEISRHLIQQADVDPKNILGIGVSGIGPCVLPVDKDHNPLRPAILYGIDTRATAEIVQFENALGREKIFQLAGCQLSSSSTAPKILWIANHEPRVFHETRWFLTCQSYLVLKLTGIPSIDAYTASTYAPIIDVERIAWMDEKIAGINPRACLPDIHWTTEIVGNVTAEAAQVTGLAAGTPVIAGTIDAAAEAISIGLSNIGEMMMMFGSSNSIILRTDKFVKSRSFWGLNWLLPETYALVGGMATVGSLSRWFLENIYHIKNLKENENSYTAMAELLHQSPPGANKLIALPYFEGERTPISDPFAKGSLFGLTLRHTQADIYRALLEGVGFGIRHNIESLRGEGVRAERILSVGGGSKNLGWMQLICDICNITMEIPASQSGSSYGDAFLAGMGVGVFDEISDIYHWLEPGVTLRPQSELHHQYLPLYEIYLELYQQTKGLMKRLSD